MRKGVKSASCFLTISYEMGDFRHEPSPPPAVLHGYKGMRRSCDSYVRLQETRVEVHSVARRRESRSLTPGLKLGAGVRACERERVSVQLVCVCVCGIFDE